MRKQFEFPTLPLGDPCPEALETVMPAILTTFTHHGLKETLEAVGIAMTALGEFLARTHGEGYSTEEREGIVLQASGLLTASRQLHPVDARVAAWGLMLQMQAAVAPTRNRSDADAIGKQLAIGLRIWIDGLTPADQAQMTEVGRRTVAHPESPDDTLPFTEAGAPAGEGEAGT